MRIGRFSTDRPGRDPADQRPADQRHGGRSPVDRLRGVARSVTDVPALVAFRAAAVRGRSRRLVAAAFALLVVLTVTAGWAPAHLPGAGGKPLPGGGPSRLSSFEIALVLPSVYLSALAIAIIAAASAGGGRELLPREHAVAFPVSPTTDHLGALLMAPLNIAWLLQGWITLAATAFALGPDNLLAVQVPVLLWLAVATAAAQLIGWAIEWLRRGRHGVWLVRGAGALLASGGGWLIATDRFVPALDRSPTLEVLLVAIDGARGRWADWAQGVGTLLFAGLLIVVAGALVAHALARRPVLEETRMESWVRERRPNPASDLAALVRVDRAGVWRAVPLRRGFAVLALLPGLVALASRLEWHMLTILPGLVASGGTLLFGVNAWALDARGALWRETLPVPPRLAFTSRTLVLTEVLVAATGLTLVLASLRTVAPPTVAELVAVLCATVVVIAQVVSGSMRWSVSRPFAVDLRSARATPAPPLTMVGYSTRLALVTTLTAVLFAATAQMSWQLSVLLAVPFLLVSALRLTRTAAAWATPHTRSRVVTTVAA